ncbi:leucine-rich repeat-containing protein 41 [Acipenser ruthenus]|uniref:leucine-rich repeat-containing protein 41 n=1 Tax=Acipenser ruthenus TaxID=7906 RepID=UPI0027414298|nr:leucine-rich repeat-containing protein 41 [Acipenser ruthenus]
MANEDKAQSLVQLCAKSVCKDMGRLEQQVWDLPASLIEELLPFLNIFYLERIEEVAVRKGLSTTSVWLRIWMEVVKYKPLGSKPVKDWRQKFLEYLFHCVLLRKSLAEDNPRLQDPRFSALTLGARYVQRLTLSSHPYGAVRLATDELRPILEILQGTVTQLKLHHFSQRSHEASMKSMTLLLHRLIHHGSVHTLTIINCDKAIPFILIRVLRMSAGQLDLEMREDLGVCFCCDRESDVKLQSHGLQRRCCAQQEKETVATTKDSGKNSSGVLQPLPLQEGKGAANICKRLSDNRFYTTHAKWPRLEQGVEAGECFNTLEPSTEGTPSHTATPQSSQDLGGERILFRSITALEVDLSSTIIPELQALLPSWVSLCSLDLFGNRFSEKSDLLKVVAALRSLCKRPEGSISALSIDSVFCPMPITAFMVNLLSTCPKLETLSLNFDVEEEDRLSPPQPIPIDISLTKLQVVFPDDPIQLQVFLSVLRIAQSLQHLHLSWTSNQGFGTLLLTLIESNPNLCWLTLKGANLSACQKEVICFLKNSSLQGVDFTDCRLFEKNKVEFLGKLVDAVKGSKTLKFLHLSKNRLGNKGLVTLAELFSGNPTSQIEHLNISANCILPDGLLEFGRLLEQQPPSSRLLLDLRQNPLDRDPGTAQQAMELLRRRCQVVGDLWNSRAAFADFASVM